MAGPPPRSRPDGRAALAGALVLAAALAGCAQFEPLRKRFGGSEEPAPPPPAGPSTDAVQLRAQLERAAYLELEVERLRADLHQAEEAMVAIESGLRGVHTRADAVSALAEARIAVERAGRVAPWREGEAAEARRKLEDAEVQLQEGHPGSAVFFASRARRIADTLNDEARRVESAADARFIHARRVNLRAGPSTEARVLTVLPEATPVFPEHRQGAWLLVRTSAGHVGWVHGSLVRGR